MTVRGRVGSLDTPTLVDGHINNDGPVRHAFEIFAAHQARGFGAGDQHGADQQIGTVKAVEDVVPVAEQRGHVTRHHIIEVAQPVQVDVENGDVGAQAGGNLGGVGAHHAAAQNHHVGRQDPRDTAQQNAPPLKGSFKKLGALLNAHAPRHLAHGRQQG